LSPVSVPVSPPGVVWPPLPPLPPVAGAPVSPVAPLPPVKVPVSPVVPGTVVGRVPVAGRARERRGQRRGLPGVAGGTGRRRGHGQRCCGHQGAEEHLTLRGRRDNPSAMRMALAGCRTNDTWRIPGSATGDLRPWEEDDRPLHAALRARGVTVERPAWDDPDADWGAYDLVLVRTTWDYHHRRDAFVAWAERVAEATRIVNPAWVLRWNTHKSYLRDLEDLGVPVVETAWLGPGDDVAAVLRERGWTRGFLKPAVGATAEGTLRFDAADPSAAQAHAERLLARGEVMLQPYLAGVETLGERSAVAIDGEVTHFVRKVPVAGDWRVQDDHGAADFPHDPSDAERDLVARALGAVGTVLPYARVDWLLDAEGAPRLVELELVEPSLFLRHGAHAAERLADALVR
jgi:glutathione synthase/RimK-type ligase-like ATP-grasp enzyme